MWGINKRLKQLEDEGKPILTSIVGIGQMGRGLVSQMSLMQGMRPAVIVDRNPYKMENALADARIGEEAYVLANTVEEAEAALDQGKLVISTQVDLATKTKQIQAVVDATGVPELGARIALDAIANKKHMIMLNVETDIVIGPLLKKKADEAGVIYTGSAGDEPGAVMELYDFATGLGFEVKAFGKGKNNKLNFSANPDTAKAEAERKKMSPRMLASFQDGTKTMVEMTAMCNATGFLPDVTGGHGPSATVDELPQVFSLKSEGGILNRYGTVDFVNGIAPGVYVIVSSPLPDVNDVFQYLAMGEGPNYVLYRPYHLTSLETPLSIAMAVLDHQYTIVPLGAPVAETVTVAKVDLKAGQYLDGIGGYTVYGTIQTADEAKADNSLPMGLVNPNTRLKVDVKKGQIIRYDMVDLDENSLVYQLRKEQDELFQSVAVEAKLK